MTELTSVAENYDAVVIGGGPGGSTAATLLARKGWRVALLERESFPRPHVGESLLPASMPVLEDLGVLDQVEAAEFPRKWGATMLWGREPEPWSWYFKETNRTYPHAYQVWRPTFDKILLDNARASGVHVCEGYQVTSVDVGTSQGNSLDYRTNDGSSGTIEAEWVVDASGQSAIVGRALGLRRWDERFRNMAVYGYFEDSERLAGSGREQHLHRVVYRRLGVEHSPVERSKQRRDSGRLYAWRVRYCRVWCGWILQATARFHITEQEDAVKWPSDRWAARS